MQSTLKVQLSVFMFLQYFIWGSWYVSMAAYLATTLRFTGQEIGAAYGAFAIGSMISPFFVGLIADRYFATEKLLGVLGLLGGAVICCRRRLPLLLTVGHGSRGGDIDDPKLYFTLMVIPGALGGLAGALMRRKKRVYAAARERQKEIGDPSEPPAKPTP
jgi:MFS family permease